MLYRTVLAYAHLVLVTEGTRLLDYDTGEVAAWAVEALSGWTSRALLTPVYPASETEHNTRLIKSIEKIQQQLDGSFNNIQLHFFSFNYIMF